MKEVPKKSVHHTLAHSYTVFFSGLLIGLALDLFYPWRFLPSPVALSIGVGLIILAPLLIFWAQYTSNQIRLKKEQLTREDFRRGPYAFSRNPTHLGLGLLVWGFGFLLNSPAVILLTVISFFISHSIFIKEQEGALERNYGEAYVNYKESVRRWF